MLIQNRFFTVFRTAARGLESQRMAMGAASENIANATTTRTADGAPYEIKRTVQEVDDVRYQRFGALLDRLQSRMQTTDPAHMQGPSLQRDFATSELGPTTAIEQIQRYRTEYDPTHPHADAAGYVTYPDVNVVEEMTRMISANRIYEANLSAVQAAKEMIKRSLEI